MGSFAFAARLLGRLLAKHDAAHRQAGASVAHRLAEVIGVGMHHHAATDHAQLTLKGKAAQHALIGGLAVNTGLKIAGPKDNGAVWAIAQNMRMDVQAYSAVTQSLNRTLSVVDTAVAAGTTISDLLKEMKEKALAARDPTIDANSREAYNADFIALRDQITKTLDNALFDGTNLLDGSTSQVLALANAEGDGFITVTARDLSLSGSIVGLTSTVSGTGGASG